jgi:hypothetical protein
MFPDISQTHETVAVHAVLTEDTEVKLPTHSDFNAVISKENLE